MARKSRSDYFKERRKATKTFYVEVETSVMDKLEKYLLDNNKTKKEWLLDKIREDVE